MPEHTAIWTFFLSHHTARLSIMYDLANIHHEGCPVDIRFTECSAAAVRLDCGAFALHTLKIR